LTIAAGICGVHSGDTVYVSISTKYRYSSGSYPVYRTDEGKEISLLGEFEAADEFKRRAFEYIGKHPLRTLMMYPLKFLNFWRLYPRPVTQTRSASVKSKALYALFWTPVLVMSLLYC